MQVSGLGCLSNDHYPHCELNFLALFSICGYALLVVVFWLQTTEQESAL
jgi:hypothetical protein